MECRVTIIRRTSEQVFVEIVLLLERTTCGSTAPYRLDIMIPVGETTTATLLVPIPSRVILYYPPPNTPTPPPPKSCVILDVGFVDVEKMTFLDLFDMY